MADFKTHILGAAAVSGVAATALVMTGAVDQRAVAGYFTLGVIGGLLPDVDSDSSVPVRMAFNLLAVVAGFLVVFTFGRRYSLTELVLLWLACFIGIRYGLFSLFAGITVHRGLIHSIPAGICFGLLATLLAYRLFHATPLQAWLCGVFILLGFLVHLVLDECYSVNLMGLHLKNSFGTALSLGKWENPYGTLALYLAAAGLFYLCPPPAALLDFVQDERIQRTVLERLLPERGWFNGLSAGPFRPWQ